MRSHLVSIWPQRATNEERVMIATQAPWGLGYNPEIRASHPIYPGDTHTRRDGQSGIKLDGKKR